MIMMLGRTLVNCVRYVCDEVDINPWGTTYRVDMARLKGMTSPELEFPLLLRKMLSILCSTHLQYRRYTIRESLLDDGYSRLQLRKLYTARTDICTESFYLIAILSDRKSEYYQNLGRYRD